MKTASLKLSLVLAALISQTALAQTKSAPRGGLDAGGGNAVGGQLFDDSENAGSIVISKAKVAGQVEPFLKALDAKLPDLAKDLRAAVKTVTWYLEPKGLAQDGACLNKSSVMVERKVVACQSKVQVRIDKTWFEENTGAQSPLLLHELLVNRQLRLPGVSDESVREISRQIRNTDISAADLKSAVKEAGFGFYMTAYEKSSLKLLTDVLKRHCTTPGAIDGYKTTKGVAIDNLAAFLKKIGATKLNADAIANKACEDAPNYDDGEGGSFIGEGLRGNYECASAKLRMTIRTREVPTKKIQRQDPVTVTYTIRDIESGETRANGTQNGWSDLGYKSWIGPVSGRGATLTHAFGTTEVVGLTGFRIGEETVTDLLVCHPVK